uniref:SF3b1 domain-containing protein n=1 Tax=Macrostomum lignano TaxID=282301 RepID=A0A1I8FAU6_9PLAT
MQSQALTRQQAELRQQMAEKFKAGELRTVMPQQQEAAPAKKTRPASRADAGTPSAMSASGGCHVRPDASVAETPGPHQRRRRHAAPGQFNEGSAAETPVLCQLGVKSARHFDAHRRRRLRLASGARVGTRDAGETPSNVGRRNAERSNAGVGHAERFYTGGVMTAKGRSWMTATGPLSDEDLDAMLPEGYKVLAPPAGYVPLRTPRRLTATPTPLTTPRLQDGHAGSLADMQPKGTNLPMLKPDDMQYFDKLLTDSREFGAGPLFNQILPLLMSPTLEDQERHLLVKVIDRVLYKLDDLVRPFVHKILVVIEPLLIDEDYYARVEGREIISNLAKAAGLATMITTMRPDLENMDEYVRNTTARAFAVSAIVSQGRVQVEAQLAGQAHWYQNSATDSILMGCAVLPHLRSLVEIIELGLVDEQARGGELSPLWLWQLWPSPPRPTALSHLIPCSNRYGKASVRRGKGLAAFLSHCYLIPLMDAEYANYYTREVMLILIREFQSPDEEMKKIVLKVVKQCCSTEGVEPAYIKKDFAVIFQALLDQKMASSDRRNYRQLVDTTVEIANKVDSQSNCGLDDLKEPSEQYRKMVMDTVEKVLNNLGATEVDSRLEEQLIDGVMFAFSEQTNEDAVMAERLRHPGERSGQAGEAYLPQICGNILWRLNNKSAKCANRKRLMGHLGVVLYEYLGEEYRKVLGSILGALKSHRECHRDEQDDAANQRSASRLTPILKNRTKRELHRGLVGRIADRGSEFVSVKEWMRICSSCSNCSRRTRRVSDGPQLTRSATLPKLLVRMMCKNARTGAAHRAIAIVAENCSPFTVLPGANERVRVPELNVQNGVLKSLSFMFEYIGEMGKDYVYAVSLLLEDALMDRDLVHRQTAMFTIATCSGCVRFRLRGRAQSRCLILPANVFETSPHVVQAFNAAGSAWATPGAAVLPGWPVPSARKVRDMMWKVYNTVYHWQSDCLVSGYPAYQTTIRTVYKRHELFYVL